MLSIAFVTQKGGAGKTTIAACTAVAAAAAGEKVIAFDLDPQGSLGSWGERRSGTGPSFDNLTVERFPENRLKELPAIIEALGRKGFTVAILDTAGVDNATARIAMQCADMCLMPARPSRLDIEATGATFRAVMRMGKKVSFVLNQCPPTPKSTRALEAAQGLKMLGVLADPMMTTRADFQDAIAAGLGVTEYAPEGKAASETVALWTWIEKQLRGMHVTQAAVGY
ncbi:AAA family ATPase [Bradyrhizobium sp. STM 3809]|uniref:nucleotide-binding protein n=1 Tax=Bradyrhizobium sp. STM 3809 TaxID=551936 RepID=UPI0002406AD5|nr:AAA family ATPase [Bradyrhizobium sp. STM 3809]CCD97636.1 putative ParA family partition protein [Bradyrhizobium sp. STM 3809]